jgi:hypothetical protein
MRVPVVHQLILVFMLFGISIASAPRPALSQNTGETCEPKVQEALTQVGDLCNNLSRNSACYGNANVEATFADTESASLFTKPGDTATVTNLQSIQTAPLDETSDIWGVSLLRLQANVPDSLPGQGVVFVLFGDVGIENAVSPENVFTPASQPVPVTTGSAANLRSGPSTNANVFVSIPAGTELPADATSADKEWLRVVSETTVGWVNKGVVNAPAGGLDQLPVLTRTARSPMQSFYLTSTLSDVNCKKAPPLVVVQGPEGVKVDLTVNGVNISMASTVVLRLSGPRTLEITAIHGNVRVNDAPLPPGFAVSVPLSEDGHNQDGDLANLHPLIQAELEALTSIEFISANVLNYPIKLPTLSEINQLAAAVGGGGGGGAVSAAAAAHVTCRSLRLTSPLDAWGRKPTVFYWDPAPGATSYRLIIDSVGSVDTPTTNAPYDLTSVLGVDSLTWRVQALYNGEVACVTRPLTLPFDPGAGGGSGGQNCHYDMATYSMVCN